MIFLHLFVFVLVTAVVVTAGGNFREYFSQTNILLDPPVELAIRITYSFVLYWHVFFLFGMGFDMLMITVLSFGFRSATWPRTLYSHLWLTGMLLLVLFMLGAMSIPFPYDVPLPEAK